jgi:chaperonin GroES
MAKVNIKPLFDNVLVKPLQAEETLPSGIILPDSAKEKPQMGEVMAVGPGKGGCCDEGQDGDNCCVDEMVVKVGQKVMYKKWGGNEVKVNGQEWMLVEQKDILAIVE